MRPVMRARQNVGRQGVAETESMGAHDFRPLENWRQHPFSNPA